jgi:hypothetical protein
LPLPFLDIKSIGILGKWKKMHGNFVLLPPDNVTPLGVIHFVGGAFVGAAPHFLYRSFLESMNEQGYIIVATPYELEMDYLQICDQIIQKFDRIAVELANTYGGALPVIGIGHSLGALLQVLITSLFPDTPRAVNILISFNSQTAMDAIPYFQEWIIPLSRQFRSTMTASPSTSSSVSPSYSSISNDTVDTLRATINQSNLHDTATNTKDQHKNTKNTKNPLRSISSLFSTSPTSSLSPWQTALRLRSLATEWFTQYADSPISPIFVKEELLPALQDSVLLIDQLPPLLFDIGQGTEDFTPNAPEIKEVCRRMYRARRTLLIAFEEDTWDESLNMASVLREANTIMRMKRPMIEMEVNVKTIAGTHVTPMLPSTFLLPLLDSPYFPKPFFTPFRTNNNNNNNIDNSDSSLPSNSPLQELLHVKTLVQEISLFLSTGVRATNPLP